jgi:hypothetical protein
VRSMATSASDARLSGPASKRLQEGRNEWGESAAKEENHGFPFCPQDQDRDPTLLGEKAPVWRRTSIFSHHSQGLRCDDRLCPAEALVQGVGGKKPCAPGYRRPVPPDARETSTHQTSECLETRRSGFCEPARHV